MDLVKWTGKKKIKKGGKEGKKKRFLGFGEKKMKRGIRKMEKEGKKRDFGNLKKIKKKEGWKRREKKGFLGFGNISINWKKIHYLRIRMFRNNIFSNKPRLFLQIHIPSHIQIPQSMQCHRTKNLNIIRLQRKIRMTSFQFRQKPFFKTDLENFFNFCFCHCVAG